MIVCTTSDIVLKLGALIMEKCKNCDGDLVKILVNFKAKTVTWRCVLCGKTYTVGVSDGKLKYNPINNIKWSTEQEDVISSSAKLLAINATAGSGKSSTLVQRALTADASKSLFVAFNRDAAYFNNEKLGLGYGPQRPRGGVSVTLHQLAWACLNSKEVLALNRKDAKLRGILFELQKKIKERIHFEFGGKDINYKRPDGIYKTLINYMNNCVQSMKEPSVDFPAPGKKKDYRYIPLAQEFLNIVRDNKLTSFELVDLSFEYAIENIYGISSIKELDPKNLDVDNLPRALQEIEELLIDEAQDLTPLQWKLIDTICEANKCKLTLVGDADQCLIAGTKIRTANGEKLIEDIKAGDMVICGSRYEGSTSAQVSSVKSREISERVFCVETESGKKVTGTSNHIVFASFKGLKDQEQYIVYLMYKNTLGYRVGVTSTSRAYNQQKSGCGLSLRVNHEHADAAWILDVVDSRLEALKLETVYSYKYGIPQLVFNSKREGMVLFQDKDILNIYQQLDTATGAQSLLADKNMYQAYPHILPKSAGIYTEQPRKRSVHLTLCGHKNNIGHYLSLHGINDVLKEKLETVGLKLTKDKRNFWRFRRVSSNLKELEKDIETIKSVMPVQVKLKARFNKNSLAWTPMSHVKPGMILAVYDAISGEVIEERVSKVSSYSYNGPVYDLNVDNYHNYIANSIVVHNCIYSWRFADVEQFLNRCSSEQCTLKPLSVNFRSGKNIINAANKLIKHNNIRLDKEIHNYRTDDGEVRAFKFGGTDVLVSYIADTICDEVSNNGRKHSDFAVLARTNLQLGSLEYELFSRGIPTNTLGRRSILRKEICEIIDVLLFFEDQYSPSVIQTTDDKLAFNAFTNLPGIGTTSIEKALETAVKLPGLDLIGALGEVVTRDDAKKSVEKMKAFKSQLAMNTTLDSKIMAVKQFLYPEQTTIVGQLDEGESGEMSVEEIVAPLVDLARNCKSLDSIVEFMDSMNAEQSGNHVTLTTIHKAKGLEWHTVFVTNCIDGSFPHAKSTDDIESERRLFFVATTRAKDRLIYCVDMNPTVPFVQKNVNPSPFLYEAGGGVDFKLEQHKPLTSKPKIDKEKAVTGNELPKDIVF